MSLLLVSRRWILVIVESPSQRMNDTFEKIPLLRRNSVPSRTKLRSLAWHAYQSDNSQAQMPRLDSSKFIQSSTADFVYIACTRLWPSGRDIVFLQGAHSGLTFPKDRPLNSPITDPCCSRLTCGPCSDTTAMKSVRAHNIYRGEMPTSQFFISASHLKILITTTLILSFSESYTLIYLSSHSLKHSFTLQDVLFQPSLYHHGRRPRLRRSGPQANPLSR